MAESLFDMVLELRSLYITRARGNTPDEGRYVVLRKKLLAETTIGKLLPDFVRRSFSSADFWSYIQPKFPSYRERTDYIRAEFDRALHLLDEGVQAPGDELSSEALVRIDAQHVRDQWAKALQRRTTDPDGAVTSARSLLEGLCKHVLDEVKVEYGRNDDLPKLFGRVAAVLDLEPAEGRSDGVRQALGGCFSLVNGLTALRNARGDAHGQGQRAMKAAPRHAEFAVSVSGAVAAFLISTYEDRVAKGTLKLELPKKR